MKKRLKMTVLLGTLGLIVPLMAGCGSKKPDPTPTPTHTHEYVEHAAKAPNCTEPGNELYYSCSGCDKYFDSTKAKEIEKDSWVIKALGHKLVLKLYGDFETSYYSGDTFDTTDLTVKKECSREGCNFGEATTDYSVVYEQDGATAFGPNDTKVTIVSGELSVDQAVSISLHDNEIHGLEDSYDLHCQTALDLTGISADEGAVGVTYYSDEALTTEIEVEDLVGDATYYAVVESDGVNPNYEVARDTTVLNVTHEYEEKVSQTAIGYKDLICKYCEHQKPSENIMAESDISITGEESYGMNAFGISKDTTEGINKAGCPLFGSEAEAEEFIDAYLPRVNFTCYSNVVFKFGSNAETWGGGYIGIGIFEANDLAARVKRSQFATFTLEATYVELESKLYIVLEDDSGTQGKATIDNADVINGVESLSLILNVALYRYIGLTNIYLNHTHELVGEQHARRDHIGLKYGYCTCGMQVAGDLMSEAESQFGLVKDAYDDCFGANCDDSYPHSDWTKDVTDVNGICFVWNTTYDKQDGLLRDVRLPKVDYTVLNSITYTFKAKTDSSRHIKFGFVNDGDLFAMGNHAAFNLVISYHKAEGMLSITAQDYTNNATNTVEGEVSEAVLFGKDNLVLKTATNITGTRMGLNKVLLNHDCSKCQQVLTPRTDVIGYMDAACACCGNTVATEAVMTDKDFVIESGASFGSAKWDIVGEKQASTTSWIPAGTECRNSLTRALGTATDAITDVKMPRINYSAYNKVQFEIRSNATTTSVGIGINAANDLITMESHGNNWCALIEVTPVAGEDKVNVKATGKSFDYSKSVVLDNADVISGDVGMTLIMQQSVAGYRAVSICRFGFNHDAHDELGGIAAKDVIGYKEAACSTCGETAGHKSSTLVMADADISLINMYGANIVPSTEGAGIYCKYQDGYILYNFGGITGGVTCDLNMPKVNYNLYNKVVMNIVVPSGWFHMGLDETNKVQCTKDATTATLTVEKDAQGAYSVSLKWVESDGSTIVGEWSKALADADVLSGVKSLALYGKEPYGNPNRVVRITSINVTRTA